MKKALLCTEISMPEQLVIKDVPCEQPAKNQITIAVKSCGLNFFDNLIIADKYQVKPTRPFSPGGEIAGEVIAIGDAVTDFSIGERVIACCGYGGLQEQHNVDSDLAVRLPDGLDFSIAVSLIITYGTAFYALAERAGLKAGEIICILGASGGVGLAAVEIAHNLGARVIAATSSAQKSLLCESSGAHLSVNYCEQPLKDWLKQNTKPKGLDVVFDPIGGQLAQDALRCLGNLGRFLVIGFAGGQITNLPLNLVLLKNIDVLGIHWGVFVKQSRERYRKNLTQLCNWALEKRINPAITVVDGLEETAGALRAIMQRKTTGKMVVRIRP